MSDIHDSCEDIMVCNTTTLHPEMTLNEAFKTIYDANQRYLPVVDNDNFVGIFSSMTLIKLLLPRSVSIKEGKNPFDLSFMRTTIEELRDCLNERGSEKITDYILTDNFSPVHPDTSIMEALHILYKNHCHVVITAKGSRQFLGVVTIHSILEHIQRKGQ